MPYESFIHNQSTIYETSCVSYTKQNKTKIFFFSSFHSSASPKMKKKTNYSHFLSGFGIDKFRNLDFLFQFFAFVMKRNSTDSQLSIYFMWWKHNCLAVVACVVFLCLLFSSAPIWPLRESSTIVHGLCGQNKNSLVLFRVNFIFFVFFCLFISTSNTIL